MGSRRPRVGEWDDSVPGMRFKPVVRHEGLEMTLYRIAPASLFPAHIHPEAQFSYLRAGGGIQRVGGIVRHVRAGDAWYTPPNAPHEFESDPQGRVELINVLVAQPEGTSPQAAVAVDLLRAAASRSFSDTSYLAARRGRRPKATVPG